MKSQAWRENVNDTTKLLDHLRLRLKHTDGRPDDDPLMTYYAPDKLSLTIAEVRRAVEEIELLQNDLGRVSKAREASEALAKRLSDNCITLATTMSRLEQQLAGCEAAKEWKLVSGIDGPAMVDRERQELKDQLSAMTAERDEIRKRYEYAHKVLDDFSSIEKGERSVGHRIDLLLYQQDKMTTELAACEALNAMLLGQGELATPTGQPIEIYDGAIVLTVEKKSDGLIRLSFDNGLGHPMTWDLAPAEAAALRRELPDNPAVHSTAEQQLAAMTAEKEREIAAFLGDAHAATVREIREALGIAPEGVDVVEAARDLKQQLAAMTAERDEAKEEIERLSEAVLERNVALADKRMRDTAKELRVVDGRPGVPVEACEEFIKRCVDDYSGFYVTAVDLEWFKGQVKAAKSACHVVLAKTPDASELQQIRSQMESGASVGPLEVTEQAKVIVGVPVEVCEPLAHLAKSITESKCGDNDVWITPSNDKPITFGHWRAFHAAVEAAKQTMTGERTYTYREYQERFSRQATEEPDDPREIGREMARKIINGLDAEAGRQYTDAEQAALDGALAVLAKRPSIPPKPTSPDEWQEACHEWREKCEHLADMLVEIAKAHGWRVIGEYLMPPEGHPANQWVCKWCVVRRGDGVLRIPGYLPRAIADDLERRGMDAKRARLYREHLQGIIDHQGDQLAALGDTERQELTAERDQLRAELDQLRRDHSLLAQAKFGELVTGEQVAEYRRVATEETKWRRAAEANLDRLKKAFASEGGEIEQILGKALGYATLYPHASEVDDGQVSVGEHTPVTIAMEAAGRLTAAEAELARIRGALAGIVGLSQNEWLSNHGWENTGEGYWKKGTSVCSIRYAIAAEVALVVAPREQAQGEKGEPQE